MAGPMAGGAGMRFWSFLGWNFLGAFIWCSVMITIGYFVGKQLDPQWITITGLLVAPATWLLPPIGVIVTVLKGELLWRNSASRKDGIPRTPRSA
jgi:membrane protein DedA with SNARE-associated domain